MNNRASLQLGGDNWAAKDGNLLAYKTSLSEKNFLPIEFTFERGADIAATRVNSAGLIEKYRENLLINSVWDGVSTDTRPTGWSAQLVSGTGTFDVTDTEGQIRFQTLDASSRAFIYSPTIATNGIVVASVYVDEVNTALPLSNMLTRSANATFLFAYEDGVEINYSDNVQAGKRYSVVFNKTASTTFRFGVGTGSEILGDVVLSRPQIERGLVATELITSPVGSTGKAGILEDLPRIDYSGSSPSLLLEPGRTNLIANSEYLSEELSGIRMTINDLVNTSPEGVVNASKLVPDTTPNSTHQSNTISYGSFVSGDKITISMFAKADGFDGIILRFRDTSGAFTTNRIAKFDLSRGRWENDSMDGTTGVMTGEVGMEDYGNGWYRCFATATADASGDIDIRIPAVDVTAQDTYNEVFTGDDTSGILIYGLQLEEGSYPTSYIPTYGTTDTRAADICDRGADLAYTGDYTLFMEFELTKDAVYFLTNTSLAYRLFLERDDAYFKLGSSNVFFQSMFDWEANLGTNIKMAFTKSGTTAIMYVNGTKYTPSTNTLSTGNEILDWRYLDYSTATDRQEQAYVKQLLEFKESLSDDELATLTT